MLRKILTACFCMGIIVCLSVLLFQRHDTGLYCANAIWRVISPVMTILDFVACGLSVVGLVIRASGRIGAKTMIVLAPFNIIWIIAVAAQLIYNVIKVINYREDPTLNIRPSMILDEDYEDLPIKEAILKLIFNFWLPKIVVPIGLVVIFMYLTRACKPKDKSSESNDEKHDESRDHVAVEEGASSNKEGAAHSTRRDSVTVLV